MPVQDGAGALHLELRFRRDLADHPMLNNGMAPIEAFVRRPGVEGIVPLVGWDRSQAAFVYPCGDAVLLASVLEDRAAYRLPAGVRAGLELLVGLGPLIDRACAGARAVGLPNHGALTPWRILIDPSRSLSLVGLGLPAVEVTTWLDEETDQPPGPALRFFPPERIEDREEDVRSDLYAVALCAAELMLGRPVIEGEPSEIVDAVLEGRIQERIEAAADALIPAGAKALLLRAAAHDPAQRFPSGAGLSRQAEDLLQGIEGASLFRLAESISFVGAEDTVVASSIEASLEAEITDAAPPRCGPSALPPVESTPDPIGSLPSGGEDESTDITAIHPDTGERERERLRLREPVPSVPPVAPLPKGATVEQIKEHGRQVAERSATLAESAVLLAERIASLTPAARPEATTRAVDQAADRSRRASESARRAADLLELDEDEDGATITLELVRNAEMQCERAWNEVATVLQEFERRAERIEAQARALADTVRRAAEHARVALEAAAQADELVTTLERARGQGALSTKGCGPALEQAIAAAEETHVHADAASAEATSAGRAPQVALALRHAEAAARAEEAALECLESARVASERGLRVEEEARQIAISDATSAASEARLALEEAQRAQARAEEAAELVGAPQVQQILERCVAGVASCEAAATLAKRAAADAQAAAGAAGARSQAVLTREALERARIHVRSTVEASDEIVKRAGAVAEARARLAKLTEEADTLLEHSRLATTRLRESVEALIQETAALTGETVSQQRTLAIEETAAAEAELPDMERQVVALKAALEEETIRQQLPELRLATSRIEGRIEVARDAIRRARDASASELAALRQAQANQRAVDAAADEAAAHAEACRSLVDDAWRIGQDLSEALTGMVCEEAVQLRGKALEIIDIAEFQAGEAAASAAGARRETDPSEARAHAQTAQSFLERISADLPEAMELLQQADQLAQQVIATIGRARSEARRAIEIVTEVEAEARAAAAITRTEVEAWASATEIAGQLDQLHAALEGFSEDRAQVTALLGRLDALDNSDDALQIITTAQAAIERTQRRRGQIDTIAAATQTSAAQLQAEIAAVAEARRSVARAIDAVCSDLERVQGAAARLHDATERNQATGEESLQSQDQMQRAIEAVKTAAKQLSTLAGSVRSAATGAIAKDLADQAQAHRRASEEAVELAADAETTGVAASEREARARAEAEQRGLANAKETATAAIERVHQTMERLDEILDQAEEEGAGAGWEPAHHQLTEAMELGESLRARVAEVEASAAQTHSATDAATALALAESARALSEELAIGAVAVQQQVQAALDLARTAAEEAESLIKVRAEVATTLQKADEAVVRARTEAKRILGILREAPRTEVRALADEAARHIQAATKAAAKVKAASPLADQADRLDSAQAILKTSRLALERANEAADAVQELVDQALERLRAEQEAAALALQAARQRAAEPAQQAAAAAKKAEAWLEVGQREVQEAGAVEQTHAEMRALSRAVDAVSRHARAAGAAAGAANAANTLRAADTALAPVRAASEAALQAADDARAALERVRDQIAELRESAEAISTIAVETADQAASAAQVADQAEATLRQLELSARRIQRTPRTVQSAVERVRSAATNARFAAARAGQAVQRARAAATQAEAEACADEAHRALEDALDALERVVEGEKSAQQAIDAAVTAAADERARAEEKRRRHERAEQRHAEELRRREAEASAAQEGAPRRRGDDRRARL
ncbi:MAG TPA: hypothetical protein ENK18_16265, partial [Deltaproteobacteria bacterium]|nr:hypothetical protein [Deltaproteobacteria bacterium]